MDLELGTADFESRMRPPLMSSYLSLVIKYFLSDDSEDDKYPENRPPGPGRNRPYNPSGNYPGNGARYDDEEPVYGPEVEARGSKPWNPLSGLGLPQIRAQGRPPALNYGYFRRRNSNPGFGGGLFG